MHSSLPAAIRSTEIARDEAARHDVPRFASIVADHAESLRVFVASHLAEHVGGAVDAGALLEVSRARLAAHGAEAHAAWLFGVCINVAREIARAAARHLGETADAAMLLAADQLRVVRRVSPRLATVGDDLHDALLLAATGEMSIDDAALLPSLPAVLVRSRLDRALRTLDRRLQPMLQRAAA